MCCKAQPIVSAESVELAVDDFIRCLESSSPLERTYLVSSWVLSPLEPVRLAAARALQSAGPTIGIRSALEHLRKDKSPAIRKAALAAVTA